MNRQLAVCARSTLTFFFLLDLAYSQNAAPVHGEQWTRLSEILISPKPGVQAGPSGSDGGRTELDAAQARADDARREIEAGSPFALVAIKYSDGPTAKLGGDLGYFKLGLLASPLEDKLPALKLFQVSEVIRTKQGFVLIQVTDRRAAEGNPTKEIAGAERLLATIYSDSVREIILDKWYDLVPREARVSPQPKKGSVTIALTIVNTGQVALVKVEQSSWDEALDHAAKKAIQLSQPFPPFSLDYGGCCVLLRMNFQYNPARRGQ
jgi:TonB family protein